MEKQKEPSVSYMATRALADVNLYGKELTEAIRKIKQYSSEELEKKGITKDGKLNGEGLWGYINSLVEATIGKYNFDPKDPRWKASYQDITGAVKQLKNKDDLLEAVIGAYVRVATSYVAEKDQQTLASLPTGKGKDVTKRIAELTGNNVIYGPWINSATDPTEVAGIKAQLEAQLREKVNTAIATDTLEDLLKKAA